MTHIREEEQDRGSCRPPMCHGPRLTSVPRWNSISFTTNQRPTNQRYSL